MYKKLDQAALDAILECGVDEFARCGFQPASVANVARAAGVSVGVIYKYFSDKQSLFLAVSYTHLDVYKRQRRAGRNTMWASTRWCGSSTTAHPS